MIFPALRKLLTNNGRFKPDNPDYRRVYLLNTIILLYIALAVGFGLLNVITFSALALAWFAALILCLLTLLYFHRTDRVEVCSYVVIALMFCMQVAAVTFAGREFFIFSWVCVFPPSAFFLLGRRKGLAASLLLLAYITGYIAVSFQNWTPVVFEIKSVVNILGSSISLLLLISYFEASRNEAAAAVVLKNSELETANSALGASREELRLILDSTAEAIFGVDMETRCTFCNASCLEILGLKSEDELLGKDIHDLLHNRHLDGSPLPRSECNIIRTCMEGIAIHSDGEVFWRPGGSSFDVEYNSYPQYKDGVVVGAVVTFSDNTLKKLHEQQIEYYSSHDALTGLLNRNCFETIFAKADNKSSLPITVIMGDLNGLKLMNDIFGHNAGDELLVKSAEVLKKVCRCDDVIARHGGDEFVILLPKTQRQEAELIMERIRDSLSKVRVNAISCSMSLGCDTKTSAAQSLDLTMRTAENNMYRMKTQNRSQSNIDMINAIIMMLYRKYPFEEIHSANVSELCKAIGEALGLPAEEIAHLRSAGFLHDIGKIGIDLENMESLVPLTEDEEQQYRQHPVIGFRIMNLFDHTLNLADSVYSHHEHWDGSGYPRALRGKEIPLMARIIAVAGRYDTILRGNHNRSVTRIEALNQLRGEAGFRLDPQLVALFVNMMEKEVSIETG